MYCTITSQQKSHSTLEPTVRRVINALATIEFGLPEARGHTKGKDDRAVVTRTCMRLRALLEWMDSNKLPRAPVLRPTVGLTDVALTRERKSGSRTWIGAYTDLGHRHIVRGPTRQAARQSLIDHRAATESCDCVSWSRSANSFFEAASEHARRAIADMRSDSHDAETELALLRLRLEDLERLLSRRAGTSTAYPALIKLADESGTDRLVTLPGISFRAKPKSFVVRVVSDGIVHYVGYFPSRGDVDGAYARAVAALDKHMAEPCSCSKRNDR